eukprot:7491718-Pyramimonas_sp.AAC.2
MYLCRALSSTTSSHHRRGCAAGGPGGSSAPARAAPRLALRWWPSRAVMGALIAACLRIRTT